MATIETIRGKVFREQLGAMQFVAKAIDGKNGRPVLTMLKIERTDIDKVWAYAMDGYRLHIADISQYPLIPEGLYTVIKNIKSEMILQKEETETAYPDIWQLIPNSPKILSDIGNGFKAAIAHVVRALPNKITVDPQYIEDIKPDEHEWSMWHDGGTTPVGFKNETLCAVIMPFFLSNNG